MSRWSQRAERPQPYVVPEPELGAVRLLDHGQLQPPAAALELVAVSATAQQTLVTVWAARRDAAALTARTIEPSGVRSPDSRPAADAGVVVAVHDGSRTSLVTSIPALPVAHPLVDVMPDGGVLLVGVRAWWRPEGPERNAVLYDANGRLLLEQTLGDGIAHVQTTTSGDVWVGYFDEGVYGSYGWGGPGPEPVGASGLVRFGRDLTRAWGFPSHLDTPWGVIDDCYVLNVADDAVWSCYYGDFPIVRIEGEQVTSWTNDLGCPSALVADEERLGWFGGYARERDCLVRGRLTDGSLQVDSLARVVMPDGARLSDDVIVQARGRHLHVIDGYRWLRLDPLG